MDVYSVSTSSAETRSFISMTSLCWGVLGSQKKMQGRLAEIYNLAQLWQME